MAELLISDYLTSEGGLACDLFVDETSDRLALTGIPTGYVVEQAYTTIPTSARKVYQYNGGGESNPSNWTDVTSSCNATAAFQQACDDLAAAGGGTIVFDAPGVLRPLSKVEIIPYGPITLQGSGDSAVRLIYRGDHGLSIGSLQNIMVMDGMNIIGELGDYSNSQVLHASNQSAIRVGGAEFIMRNCLIAGLGSSAPDLGGGVIFVEQSSSLFESSIFNGSIGPYTGVIVLHDAFSTIVRNCQFLDYVTFRGNVYSKTPYGNTAWIRQTNTSVPLPSANKQLSTLIEGCIFDEGAGFTVHIKGRYGVEMKGCYANVGSGEGPYIEDVTSVKFEDTVIGYSTSGSKNGATFKDCGTVELTGFKLQNDVDYITISGTTRQVIMRECDLQPGHNATYPTGINNAAGADIVINGIRQVNGLTQIG